MAMSSFHVTSVLQKGVFCKCQIYFDRTPNCSNFEFGSGFVLNYIERNEQMTRALDPLLETISNGERVNLHIVDIENLAGTGWLTTPKVKEIGESYVQGTRAEMRDLFILAAGPQNKHALFDGWHQGHPIFQFRKGKDGADQALVSLFGQIEHPEKFNHIYLATGDAGLLPIAEKTAQVGVRFTVVTGVGARSWKYAAYENISIAKGN